MEPSTPPNTPARTVTARTVPYPISPRRIDQDAASVVTRLRRNGHMAYLVGGCVRDLLLGRTPKDFDIATSARPNEVRALFRNCRIIGRRFRLAHVMFGGNKIIEVATFRRDPTLSTEPLEDWELGDDGAAKGKDRGDDSDLLIRHDNVFGEPHEDAVRRDFTMNALFYDLERGEIVDYVGGLAEIERRVIRTIGEPDVRFREDPVRILRAIKFAARLDLGLEPDVYDAMVAHREDLLRSARPRLLEELLRLMRGGAARRSFWLAWETGVLAVLLPELSSWLDDAGDGSIRLWKRLGVIDELVASRDVPTDTVLVATLLLDPIDEAIDGERDPLVAVGDFLVPLIERLAVTRRMVDRLRQVLSVQKRLRQGRAGSLARRDFYPEATQVYAIDTQSRGTKPSPSTTSSQGREPVRAGNGNTQGTAPTRARKPAGESAPRGEKRDRSESGAGAVSDGSESKSVIEVPSGYDVG